MDTDRWSRMTETRTTPKLGEISFALCDLDDRYILADSKSDGMRMHIPKPTTTEAIQACIREALRHNVHYIADVLTENLPDDADDQENP